MDGAIVLLYLLDLRHLYQVERGSVPPGPDPAKGIHPRRDGQEWYIEIPDLCWNCVVGGVWVEPSSAVAGEQASLALQ